MRTDRLGALAAGALTAAAAVLTATVASAGAPIQDLAVASNWDKRMEVFNSTTDTSVAHRWQTVANKGWTGWEAFGPGNRVAAATNENGRLEFFFVWSGELWHQWQLTKGGAWSSIASFKDAPVDSTVSIAAVANQDGHLELFSTGRDDSIWHRWQVLPNGNWSNAERINGTAKALAAAINENGRVELLAVQSDGSIWRKRQMNPNGKGGGWSTWSKLPSPRASNIAVGVNKGGRLELFAATPDNALFHMWQVEPNGAWSAALPMDGAINRALAVGCNQDGRLEVFATTVQGQPIHRYQQTPGQGDWTGWIPF